MLNTETTPGFITFEPVGKYYDESPGFHTFPLGQILSGLYFKKQISNELEEQIYQTLLKSDWGILMLVGRPNAQDWLACPSPNPERFRSFARAAVQIQDQFTAIGNRFAPISGEAYSFWNPPHGLFFAMANLGFPIDEINEYREQQKIPLSILESPRLKL